MATDLQFPTAKAQHYVPKFYLKGFTDQFGVLWVCEKFKPIRASKPKKEAHRPDYYTHAEQGERDETAEDNFKIVESRVAEPIRKLANPQYKITPEKAGELYLFVALMFARVPSWREFIDDRLTEAVKQMHHSDAQHKERFYDTCRKLETASGDSLGIEYESLRLMFLKREYEVMQTSVAYNLGAMFRSAFTIFDELMNYDYEILYAPDNRYFLTSDAPVFTVQRDGMGMGSVGAGFGVPGVEVLFPLNKRACLRLKRGIEPNPRVVSEKAVEQINRVVMRTAGRHLYSSEGYRKTARLFDQYGCRVRPGRESFLTKPTTDSSHVAD
ncbi:MAG: DUF4238 domain-containing protein [Terriglobales bacterium]